MNILEYPKWVAVDGPGHPDAPGKVLVESASQEEEALRTGRGPAHLNPAPVEKPADPIKPDEVKDKSIEDMSRDELLLTLAKLNVPEGMTDDELRDAVRRAKALNDRDTDAAGEGEAEEHEQGDHLAMTNGERNEGDGAPEPITDAAGDKAAPDPAEEANKGDTADTVERTLPLPEATPGNDARPDDAKEREMGTHPATDQIEQAETKPDETKPPEEGGAAAKGSKKK